MYSCSLLCRQFLLLLRKNFLLQIRRPLGTVVELILPLVALTVLVIFRFLIFPSEDQCFITFPSDKITVPPLEDYTVYYAPNSSEANDLSILIASKLMESNGEMVGVATQDDFITAIETDIADTSRERGCFRGGVAIYFDDLSGNNIEYTIRLRTETTAGTWNTDVIERLFNAPGPRTNPTYYFDEGFVQLQKIVDESIIEWKTGETINLEVDMKQMPYPAFVNDFFLVTVEFILPLTIMLSFIFSFGVFVKELVFEKESRLRETMKIMGLKGGMLWVSWYVKQFLFMLIPTVLLAILLKVGQIFPNTSIVILIIFLVLFMLSGISFSFFISVWFNSAKLGLLAGMIIMFLQFIPTLVVNPFYESTPLALKIILSFLSNSGMGLGMQIITIYETTGEGVTFKNIAESPIDDGFSLAIVFVILIIDAILYMVLYWYIDNVKPGQYGIPKPFYFFLLPSYWCGKRKQASNQGLEEIQLDNIDASAFEEEPQGETVGISINGLTKIYNKNSAKKRKVAVDNLKLNMYKGQITALLGHNGAGKTTTMSVLTGFYPPTSGVAHINGLHVVDDADKIRRNLGICPQHNVLFDRLTVGEHLSFFGRLKGASPIRVKEEAEELLDDLHLEEKEDVQSQNLSGGMKRKLSVAIALIGGSNVVILDEPTSGMDPYARRVTWDLLLKHKEGRTIVLTTHFMDEADLLGDRIAIMTEGKVKCSGSSLFLKKRYGAGYHLTIEKQRSCDITEISELVKQIVEGAEEMLDIGAELQFLLPSNSSSSFPELLDTLEERKSELHVEAFGLSVTTMEEVFIKVGEDKDETLCARIERKKTLHDKRRSSPVFQLFKRKSSPFPTSNRHMIVVPAQHELHEKDLLTVESAQRDVQDRSRTPSPDIVEDEDEDVRIIRDSGIINEEITVIKDSPSPKPKHYVLNKGFVLWIQQFNAMFVKRFFNTVRFWQSFVLELVFPVAFVIIALIIAKFVGELSSNDVKRSITIQSSTPSDNRTLFWAQFGSGYPITFRSNDASILGATEFFDYTKYIEDIMTSVENHTDINNCCNYEKQILDKYCASRTMKDYGSVCDGSNSFGYRSCMDCLECCEASLNRPATCTHTIFENVITSRIAVCPVPPVISISERSEDPTGILDSVTVYVDERLLLFGGDDELAYVRNVQGGFVLHTQDPVYSTCGCENVTETCDHLSTALVTNFPTNPQFSATMLCNAFNDTFESDCGTLNELNWINDYVGVIDACLSFDACRLTGQLGSCQCSSNCHFGQTSIPSRMTPPQALTMWYTNQPYHMPAAILNAFYNLYLKQFNSSLNIRVNNHPLPRDVTSQAADTEMDFLPFLIGVIIVFGLSLFYSNFIVLLIEERESKSKHLQFVSGVHSTSYWCSVMAFDFLKTSIILILIFILFPIFQIEAYSGNNLGAIALLLFLSCWTSLQISYVSSLLFSTTLVAFSSLVSFYVLGGLLCMIVYYLLSVDFTSIADTLHYVFSIHPTYALGIGLTNIYVNEELRRTCTQSDELVQACEEFEIRYTDNIFDFSLPGISHLYVYLTVELFILLALVFLIEKKFFANKIYYFFYRDDSFNENDDDDDENEDSDVADERKKVAAMTSGTESNAVVIKQFVKEYKNCKSTVCCCFVNQSKLAVDHINLIIPSGECFGLLGVNGAGKTTTFKMLTGDIKETDGTAIIAGYDIRRQIHLVQQHIGYCPQFDALMERLNSKELLTMFARLRGIQESDIKEAVQTEIDRLDLNKYADKPCGSYSGGNKRKLSTAIALVGNPPIVFLDEPTTGMDPVTRRFLWNALTSVIKEGRSVVLTSHSMEECEALCTRVAIMVNGRFKCLGSIQHLKTKFGNGYTVQLKMKMKQREQRSPRRTLKRRTSTIKEFGERFKRETRKTLSQKPTKTESVVYNTRKIKEFFAEKFTKSSLLEEHQGSMTYQIPLENVMWSTLFREMEENKEELNIIDYGISQATLDQVFVGFAREQEETEHN